MGAWSGATSAPGADEIEVSVFGRGVGEAIVVHLGDNVWITVDSCLNDDDEPVALAYLRGLGAARDVVKLVVCSHFDQDHVEGLAALFTGSPDAQFAMSLAVTDPEVVKFLQANHDPREVHPDSPGKDQLASITTELGARRRRAKMSIAGRCLLEGPQRVWALSPSDVVHTKSLARLLAASAQPINGATQPRNPTTTVLWIEAPGTCALLGGDLTSAPGNAWEDVIESAGRSSRQAGAYKVSHHGSHTGNSNVIWEGLLESKPVVGLTRCNSSHLPTDDDRAYLIERASRIGIAGRRSSLARDPADIAVLERAGVEAVSVAGPLGQVRMRCPVDGPEKWTVKVFGNAELIEP